MKLISKHNKKLRRANQSVAYDSEALRKARLQGNQLLVFLRKFPQGVALAAAQVGINKAMFVMEFDKVTKLVINPTIKNQSEEENIAEEGCLTFPGKSILVKRSKEIDVEYHNGTILVKEHLAGLEARVFQHEYDHTQGKCIISRKAE